MDDPDRKLTPPEMEAAATAELKSLHDDPQPVMIGIKKIDAFLMIGAMQLLLRHPELPTTTRAFAATLVSALLPAFENRPALLSLIHLAGDPAYDVLRDPRVQSIHSYQISDHDAANVGDIVAGAGNWFGAHLLRLIKRADPDHRRRLASIYPSHVAAFERWEHSGAKQ